MLDLIYADQKYCRMLQGKHSAILLTFMKLPVAVFNLGNFKGGHFHLILDENKTLPHIYHSHNVIDGPL